MSLLDVRGLGIAFGGIKAVDDVSFTVQPGEIYAIIGPNGAGKTTLFNLVSGIYRASSGTASLMGETITGLPPEQLARRGMSRTFQNLQIFMRMSVVDNVMVGRHLVENRSVLSHLLRLPATARQERESRAKALEHLARVGLADEADTLAGNLSYGAMKRLEIARALATGPRLLLLDEPAAGCNAVETAEIDHLLAEIAREGIAILLIEHDMKLVMAISNRVLVLESGRVLLEGTPHEVAHDPRVIRAYLGAEAASQLAGGSHA